uniref:RNA-directed DNA polymerase n=1 Tax=Fagus sylvatica TaxID=28930 RepID=A0A2N9GBG3_FAGSY
MSGVPSASRRPPSVVVEDASLSRVSSGTSYRPSRDSAELQRTAGRALVTPAPPQQPVPPQQPAPPQPDEGATSRRLVPEQTNRGDARRSLAYSTKSSQTQNSQELIAELRQEIQALKQVAKGRKDKSHPTAKERPTKRTHASQRRSPERPTLSHKSQQHDLSETSSSQSESRSPTPPVVSHKPLKPGRASRSRPPLYGETSAPGKKHQPRKTVRPGRQNAVWKAFDLISSSPFSKEIEKAKMPERYPVPRFEIYNGRTDPVTHIGHYHQSMALSRNNDPLMCRLFPSSLGEVAMRWFNQLGVRTIYSWDQLAEAFVARFITNSRKRKEMGSLLTMKLEANETLKDYSTRFWETYNDIESCGEEVAITTFKMGLPAESGLRQSLVKHPPANLGKLMYKIDQFVRIEEDGRKPPVDQIVAQPKPTIAKPVARSGNTSKNLSAPRNFVAPTFRAFETVFKEPIYKVMEKIKREPFFVWPPKMIGNPALKDGNLYCSYHRERGHMTENCHLLKVHLEKLASEGYLDQYVNRDLSSKKETGPDPRQPQSLNTPAAGIIHVIHNPSCSAVSSPSCRFKMQKAAHLRRSFSIRDAAHPAPIYSVRAGNMGQAISFSDDDLRDVQLPHNDPLVVTLRIGNYDVQRVLIDQGSFAEVMYQDLYGKLGLGEAELTDFTTPIFGFSGEPVVPLGKIMLPVLAGPINLQTEFIVVRASSPYNAIMGRDWLHRMRAVPSTLHQKLRFPTADGVMELNGDQELEDGEAIVTEQPDKVFFDSSTPEKFFLIGSNLSPVDRECLLRVLIDNQDIFAWSVYDAPGVSSDLASHSLNIKPEHRPVVQKRRKLAPERATIVLEEVERLLASGAIREVQYPAWLSNTVVVRKKNGKWRVCIDFTDLNKACPKDPFPLPRIDQLVDSASRHARLSFLDAFQGYHQIPMNPADQEKTAFITPRGTYCYRVMPFGLKNAGATYQRMVTKMFGPMLGKTVEVYIDDMLVKSLREEDHIADLLQFLGHIVSRRGIEANPDQIAALINLAEPRNIKQVQRLTGMIAALGRFISRSADKFRESTQDQRPVFFVSKTMDEAELRYLPLEKAALALLYAAKKLPHYFQSSTVTVLSDLPLKMLLQRSDFTGRITRWGVYLGSLGVEYKPRTAIKGTGAGIVLISPEGLVLEQAVRLKFSASNNEAEYEAMLIGLRTAKKLGAGNLQIFCDSQLVANQISGEYQARDDRMSAYLTVARTLLSEFDSTHVAQIGREHNSHADVLAKLATALESDMQRTVCIETLEQPSFQDQEVSVCSVNVRPSWMDPLLGYIRDNRLPEDKKEARMIKQKAPRFWVSEEGQLYRRSFTGPYLLCVHPDKVKDFLFEIHEGICGSHTGGRSLAHRALSQGYWWPYMQADALKYVQECDKCQRFAPMIHQPARELNPLSSPWPFAQWGLDIVGPLPRAPGNKKFLITATDYFTKWIEAEPLSNIRDVDTKRFLWKSIITRFGIPWAVISDNGTQFESKLFKGFCSDLGIRNFFSSPGYPQSNGQAEISNKVVLSGIKRKLEAAKGKWVEELPSVLWTYRTTTNEERLGKDLDLVEEKRNLAVVRLAAYQQQMRREHNKNVKPRTFRAGDLVLRKVMANTRRPNDGKLGPNWEGPYKVLSQTGHGAYRLEDLDGKPIPRPWNTCNLRKYFF